LPGLLGFSDANLGNNVLDSPTLKGDDCLNGACVMPHFEEFEEIKEMAEYVVRKYGKGEIDRAGKTVLKWWLTPELKLEDEPYRTAYWIVENWRECHAFPLTVFQRMLRKHAKVVDSKVTIAKRIKRLSSAMKKLGRESLMKLSQMQDLGGCRAIVADVSSVYKLYERFKQFQQVRPSPPWTIKCDDYIENPKPDGYRGIHIIGRYMPRHEKRKPWGGQRIEIQLRSKLQHAFATAVETVTAFTRLGLKFGGGPENWRRFFALMGSVLANREGTPLIEGTPTNQKELVRELRKLAKELRVRPRLRGWTKALKRLPRKDIIEYQWLLIALNVRDNSVEVTGYQDMMEASTVISAMEKTRNEDVDAVRVWVSSITELKEAYPNYYADTREFIKAMNIAIFSQTKVDREKLNDPSASETI
jgi:hypothetical protein